MSIFLLHTAPPGEDGSELSPQLQSRIELCDMMAPSLNDTISTSDREVTSTLTQYACIIIHQPRVNILPLCI